MIHPLPLSMLAVLGLSLAVVAQDNKTPAPVQIRAVLHDPVKPIANLYYKNSDVWAPFTERQLQYLDVCRRIFIVHVTPGALQPTITTIVDTNLKSARP
jgi:hypothetical protein